MPSFSHIQFQNLGMQFLFNDRLTPTAFSSCRFHGLQNFRLVNFCVLMSLGKGSSIFKIEGVVLFQFCLSLNGIFEGWAFWFINYVRGWHLLLVLGLCLNRSRGLYLMLKNHSLSSVKNIWLIFHSFSLMMQLRVNLGHREISSCPEAGVILVMVEVRVPMICRFGQGPLIKLVVFLFVTVTVIFHYSTYKTISA